VGGGAGGGGMGGASGHAVGRGRPAQAQNQVQDLYNPADMAMRHKNLFYRQPSKHFFANPQAVPRVEPILRMCSKLGILEGHDYGMPLFAEEPIDFNASPMGIVPVAAATAPPLPMGIGQDSRTQGGAWLLDGPGQLPSAEMPGAWPREDPGVERPAKRARPESDSGGGR